MFQKTLDRDPSQCKALSAATEQRLWNAASHFSGCASTSMVISPICWSSSEIRASTCIVLWYKDLALDYFLLDCIKIWLNGVARVASGGQAQEGSVLV